MSIGNEIKLGVVDSQNKVRYSHINRTKDDLNRWQGTHDTDGVIAETQRHLEQEESKATQFAKDNAAELYELADREDIARKLGYASLDDMIEKEKA